MPPDWPCSRIADPVLNDLDLWLDHAADCGGAACGERASRSRIDNVEWIIVRNPRAGVWRAKVVAPRVYTAPPRAAVAWTVIRGDATPQLAVDVAATPVAGARTRVTATLGTGGYVAAAAQLALGCRGPVGSSACRDVRIDSVSTRREDGVHTVLHEETHGGVAPGAAIRPGAGFFCQRSPATSGARSRPPRTGSVSAMAARCARGAKPLRALGKTGCS